MANNHNDRLKNRTVTDTEIHTANKGSQGPGVDY